jgi:hypothetical protein
MRDNVSAGNALILVCVGVIGGGSGMVYSARQATIRLQSGDASKHWARASPFLAAHARLQSAAPMLPRLSITTMAAPFSLVVPKNLCAKAKCRDRA